MGGAVEQSAVSGAAARDMARGAAGLTSLREGSGSDENNTA